MLQSREPFVAWARAERLGQHLAHPGAIFGQRNSSRDAADARVGVDVPDAKDGEGVGLELGGQRRQEEPAPVLALVRRVARITAAGPNVGWHLRLGGHDVELTAAAHHHAVNATHAHDLAEPGALALDQGGDGRGGRPHPLNVEGDRIHQVDWTSVERSLSTR